MAEDAGTVVLAVGAKPGEAFEARGWDDVVVAFADARAGRVAGGRAVLEEAVARRPGDWEGAYNLACFEALFGDRDAAFAQLRRAVSLGPDEVGAYAREDSDLDPLHDDPRWQELPA